MPDPKYLQQAQAGKPEPTTAGGASSYFARPDTGLDPNLFDGPKLHDDVRTFVVENLRRGLCLVFPGATINPAWLHIWIAGSGVTYQWAAARGNGDLDVLFSMDVSPFEQANPGWRGMGEDDLTEAVNEGLKAQLWPATAQARFGSQVYEVTFFWNPGTGKDIRNIHPYAAYDVLANTFSVPPPQLPDDPRSLYPDSWYYQVGLDADAAAGLSASYRANIGRLAQFDEGTVEHHAAGATLNLVVSQATALFNDIHGGRRAAFGPQGDGYGDFFNFRWQSAKESGAVKALWDIASVGSEARKAEETELYGAPIDSAEVVLRRAAQQYRDRS
jgi:hypothetical protein